MNTKYISFDLNLKESLLEFKLEHIKIKNSVL